MTSVQPKPCVTLCRSASTGQSAGTGAGQLKRPAIAFPIRPTVLGSLLKGPRNAFDLKILFWSPSYFFTVHQAINVFTVAPTTNHNSTARHTRGEGRLRPRGIITASLSTTHGRRAYSWAQAGGLSLALDARTPPWRENRAKPTGNLLAASRRDDRAGAFHPSTAALVPIRLDRAKPETSGRSCFHRDCDGHGVLATEAFGL